MMEATEKNALRLLHIPPYHAVVRKFVRTAGTWEDAIQTALLVILENRDRVRDEPGQWSYVAGLVANRLFCDARKRSRYHCIGTLRDQKIEPKKLGLSGSVKHLLAKPETSDADPFDLVPEQHRSDVRLYYYTHITKRREVAESMGLTPRQWRDRVKRVVRAISA